MNPNKPAGVEPIAIVGIGCRFPGANGPAAFWHLLIEGVDALTEVPANRFNIDAFFHPTPGVPGKICSCLGGFIDNIEYFDAEFFGIAPREAEAMDPQQRILLEVAYEAMEDAGIPLQQSGNTKAGVFLGMMSGQYLQRVYNCPDELNLTSATAASRGTAAARISRAFGLEGPALVVDTDRSSSLTAVHLACQSLRAQECAVAIAGAGNAILGPELSIACSRSGLLSSDGRCKFGDLNADGIARSEGFGVLVLKRLCDAIHDGDRVYALIRGSAISSNGRESIDLLRPSASAQEKLLRAALADADVLPGEIQYVEAHGTGTPAGDAAEIEALGAVIGQCRSLDEPCLIGSVKSNIGHAEGAAGIAGIIKVALALRHGMIPKILHCVTPNPELALHQRHLRLPLQATSFSLDEKKKAYAGVSAFGISGALAHVVMEGFDASGSGISPAAELTCVPFPLSAASPQALDALAQKYREHLQKPVSSDSFARFCYSAAVRRTHHAYRVGLVASSRDGLIEQLDSYLNDAESLAREKCLAEKSKIAFIFPGQGGQWLGMGRELLAGEPVFRNVIHACDKYVRAEEGWSIVSFLQGTFSQEMSLQRTSLQPPTASAVWEQIDYVQPALTAVMMGLAAIWRSWGIEPSAVVGLSMGEVAAAYVAGILDIHDAMAVVCRRTRLMKLMGGKGAIASVPLSLADAEQAMEPFRGQLSVAVVASPDATVISGDRAAMDLLIAQLESRGVSCRLVKVDVASHSAQMDGLLNDLIAQLKDLKPQTGSIAMLSSVTDSYVAGPELDADYWARNLRQPVLQLNAIKQLLKEGYSTFLEVSPHPVVWNSLLETIQQQNASAGVIASLRRDEAERETLLKSLTALYQSGISPDWSNVFRPEDRHFVPLPTYAWQSKPYWFQPAETEIGKAESSALPGRTAKQPRNTNVRRRVLEELRAVPSGERKEFLATYLQRAAAKIMRIPDPLSISVSAPLRQLGLTSLMSVELALELQNALQFSCSSSLIFNYPTIHQLAQHLLQKGIAESQAVLDSAAGDGDVSSPAISRETVRAQASSAPESEPIAVIGLGCRFPGGADGPENYWKILRDGMDAITEVPFARWDLDDFYDPDPEAPGKMYTRWGGFLDSIDLFDAAYFGISPREAEVLDPQQRLLLEVAVEALEHAGLAPGPQDRSDVGVFVGIMNNNEFESITGRSSDASLVSAHDSTGRATSAAAGRLSYTLGFQGPSVAIDTACSSSLVAIHLACQALRAQECVLALAGGVNVILAPETTISFCKTRMLSPTGKCRTFDAGADGYVRGEGCGIVVLKRLSDAIQNKDNILAVIRGSAVNQDGRSSSLTAPSGLAQQAVVRRALRSAGIGPSEIDYVEAHGTGTALGDPIEIEALGSVLGEDRDPTRPFAVGSVKTNIGHLEAAAGVAGLIKVILSFQNGEIPRHLHLGQVNPRISLEASRALIPVQAIPWQRGARRRLAGISSFGFVGTNAHVILEEPPNVTWVDTAEIQPSTHHLLTLSARSPQGLKELASRYVKLLSHGQVNISDLCYTANTGRLHHPCRVAFVGDGPETMRARIQDFTQPRPGPDAVSYSQTSPIPKVAFLFTGQGAQYPGMGRHLFAIEPVFRSAIERCAQLMDPLLPRGILSILNDDDPAVLQQTRFAQPAIFALEYGLLELLRSWGVEPAMVMGHSLGECVAAVASGVMSLEHAARLVVTRGLLMQSIPTPGGSAVVFAGEDFVKPFLLPFSDSLAIAADNAPQRVLIAGGEKELQAVCDEIARRGVEVRRMTGMLAAHCALMDPILDAFEAESSKVPYAPAVIPLVSTLTGGVITHQEISAPRHWREHIRQKVRFREGMRVLHDSGCRVFLEIGPRNTLVRLGQMCIPSHGVSWFCSQSKEKHGHEQILESLAELYTRGVPVRWEGFHRPFKGRKVPVPGTSFERKRFWPEMASCFTFRQKLTVSTRVDGANNLDVLLGQQLYSPLEQVQFAARVDLGSLPILKDHLIFDSPVMPAAAQLLRVLTAAGKLFKQDCVEIPEAFFPTAMVFGTDGETRVSHLVLTPAGNEYSFKISSITAGAEALEDPKWRLHVSGRVAASQVQPDSQDDLISVPNHDSFTSLSGEDFYAFQAQRGYSLGRSFRWVDVLWFSGSQARVELRPPLGLDDGYPTSLHPGLIDSCLQASTYLAVESGQAAPDSVLVPVALEGVRLLGNHVEEAKGKQLHCRISMLPAQTNAEINFKLTIFTETGNPVFSIARLHLRQVVRNELLGRRDAQEPGRGRGESKLRMLPDETRYSSVLEHLVDLLKSVTAMDSSELVREDASFEQLGVDSLLTHDLIYALETSMDLNIPSNIFIECPTIELLAGYLTRRLSELAAAS